jgi:SAM-dependent methyltransferase
MTTPVAAEFYNRTRQSGSIPRNLARQGRLLGLGLYYLLRTSDLASEGFENSGSYKFADHIYRNAPSGSNAFGRWLDARLLALPAVRSFRSRFLAARDELSRFLCERNATACHVLSVPCGIPRELVEGAALAREGGCDLSRVMFHGLDLDAAVLREASTFAGEHGLANFHAHIGDALDFGSYPQRADFVTSTGLAEFLDDEKLLLLYKAIHAVLGPGGRFVASGMQRRKISEYLLQLAEIRVHYRNAEQLEALAFRAGFHEVAVRYDSLRIQCIMVAAK